MTIRSIPIISQLILPNVPTIYTHEKQGHLRLRPSRLTLEKHSLPMFTAWALLVRTWLRSVRIPKRHKEQRQNAKLCDYESATYQSRVAGNIRSHTSSFRS